MYYPKSHITPNLYSNGEYFLKNTTEIYTGYYFSTFNNKYFTGRYPNDGKNLELTLIDPDNQSPLEDVSEDTINYKLVGDNYTYSKLKNNIDTPPIPSPTPFYPQPSEQDYQLGEFTRYFAKKANENKYTETSALFENSLYISIKLPWLITGDRDEVIRVNQNIVKLREQQLNISGLGEYLKFNYIKFYK